MHFKKQGYGLVAEPDRAARVCLETGILVFELHKHDIVS